MLIGLGFLLGLEEIKQTRLFQNYDALIPGHSGMAVGALFLLVGLIVAVTAMADKIKWTKWGLNFQAFAWMFSAIMYGMHGDYLLAAIFGVFFSIPAGYLAFYYKYAPLWAAQKKAFRIKWEVQRDLDRHSEG